jgi:hypothetical protein
VRSLPTFLKGFNDLSEADSSIKLETFDGHTRYLVHNQPDGHLQPGTSAREDAGVVGFPGNPTNELKQIFRRMFLHYGSVWLGHCEPIFIK